MNTPMPKLINSNTFHAGVEVLMKKHKLKYMDAILLYCERNSLEIETAATMVKSNAKAKAVLREEAMALHFIAKPLSE